MELKRGFATKVVKLLPAWVRLLCWLIMSRSAPGLVTLIA